MKNVLAKDNKVYNANDLYVCRVTFKDREFVSDRTIFKVTFSMLSSNVMFENLESGEVYIIKRNDEDKVEIDDMISFSDVFPDISNPNLSIIKELNGELRKINGPIKTLRA